MGDGIGTTGLTDASRIINDYKAAIERFPLAEFDWMPYVAEYKSATGGTVEITYSNLGSSLLPEVPEGAEPKFTHADLSKLLVTVKKYAIKPAVTVEMIEDSRFDELKEALDVATRSLRNTYVDAFMDELIAGPFSSTDIPDAYGENTWAAAANHLYNADHDGTPVAQSAAGHVYNTAAARLYLGDIALAVRHVREHGFVPDTMIVGMEVAQDLLDLADFVSASISTPANQDLNTLGEVRGTIMGLVVVLSPWLAPTKFIVTARAAKPLAYVTRRAPRLDTGIEKDFDIKALALSARFGFKTRWKGATVVATVTT